jgi:predicted acylesterase/phospholipase RssA
MSMRNIAPTRPERRRRRVDSHQITGESTIRVGRLDAGQFPADAAVLGFREPGGVMQIPSVRRLIMALLALGLGACATAPRAPFTPEEQAVAHVPGIPDARFWNDDPTLLLRDAAARRRAGGVSPSILALSGGGADGAFGAGLLVGWTETGTRPEFSIVSGVSAGALIAPFAFLGPEYDAALEEALTRGYAAELAELNALAGILASGLPNTERLRRVVARFVDERMIERIGEEHRRGRRLFVVTTNLDAQRGVVWNLSAVAASSRPDRLAMFRELLVASASMPGVFSPILIDVEANGRRIAELHVDGGVTRNVFVAPDPVLASRIVLPRRTSGRIFVIVNNKVAPDFTVVENSLLPVVERSVSTMVKTNTNAVLLSTYQFARRNGLEFNLAAIDPDYPTSPTITFDRQYMLALFQHGIERARSGRAWQRTVLPEAPMRNRRAPAAVSSQGNPPRGRS